MALSARAVIVAALGAPLAVASTARADLGAQVAIGGGVHAGDALSAIDARADWERDGGGAALGLGVRLRAIGDGFDRGDWDSAEGWIAIVRYLELRRDDGAFELAAGAQPSVIVGDGALIGGVIPAALLDRRATGVHARARAGRAAFEAAIDDVAAPTVIGARAVYARDPDDDDAHVALDVAADPFASSGRSARLGAAAISGALTTRYREVTDRVELGVRATTAREGGAWLAATTAADLGDARFALRGEVTLGAPPPFGPLYAIERTSMPPPPDGDGAGLGGAVRLDVDALAIHADASMRARPGLGGEFDARVAAPAYRDVQLAALVAGNPSRGLYVGGGELRVRAGGRAFVGVEAARQIDAATARPAWQAIAWLGFASIP